MKLYVSYFFSGCNIEMAAETQAQTIMTTPIQSRDHAKGWAKGSLAPPKTPHFCAKKNKR